MKDMNLKHCQFCGGTTFLAGIYPLGEKYRIGIVCISCFGRMDTKEIYSTYDGRSVAGTVRRIVEKEWRKERKE